MHLGFGTDRVLPLLLLLLIMLLLGPSSSEDVPEW